MFKATPVTPSPERPRMHPYRAGGSSWQGRLRPHPTEHLRWTPHPVIVTIGDIRDDIRVLLYSHFTTITGRGVILQNTSHFMIP